MEQWKSPQQRQKLMENVLYVTLWVAVLQDRQRTVRRGLRVEIITRWGWHSPILLHAPHAAESGCVSIVVTVEDTDVLALCLAMFNKISWRMYYVLEMWNKGQDQGSWHDQAQPCMGQVSVMPWLVHLVCMPLQAVTLSLHSLARGRRQPLECIEVWQGL